MAVWTEGERKSGRGQKLHTVTALPEDRPPKAVLVWHHGASLAASALSALLSFRHCLPPACHFAGLQEHVGRYKQSEA